MYQMSQINSGRRKWSSFLCFTFLGNGVLSQHWAADVVKCVGEEGRYIGDDRHQRAVCGGLFSGCHGDDNIVLVPHVKGVLVGVADGGGYVQWAESFCIAILFYVLL